MANMATLAILSLNTPPSLSQRMHRQSSLDNVERICVG